MCLLYASLWGIKPVWHDRHKTVPEFILMPYDVDGNHISTITDHVKSAGTFCLKGRFDLGTFYC